MASLGDLERAVMDVLWDAGDVDLTAYDVQDRLNGVHPRSLAVTTLLTVLSRLAKKGLVSCDRSVRPHHYRATASRSTHVATLMNEVLGEAVDHRAVLERFVGQVSAEDAAVLRRLLSSDGSAAV